MLLCSALLMNSRAWSQSSALPEDPEKIKQAIFHQDSLFWAAYNACDIDKMAVFFTDDVEFYHDKGGVTTSRAAVIATTRKNLCGNENFRLRREAVEGSVEVFELANYGGLISGKHLFYINETGKKERLDGLARFTQVWQYKDNQWRMSRVLSYDHGPAPYKAQYAEVTVSPALLRRYAGKYVSARAGTMDIQQDGNTMKLVAGDFQVTFYPASDKLFFLKERDLQIEFASENSRISKVIVHEHGNVIEEAKRLD